LPCLRANAWFFTDRRRCACAVLGIRTDLRAIPAPTRLSLPRRADAHFAQRTEVEPKEGDKLKVGDTFYEPTGCLHRVSKNAGKTKARVLAVLLVPQDAKELSFPEKPAK
jgi:hypothetical protein